MKKFLITIFILSLLSLLGMFLYGYFLQEKIDNPSIAIKTIEIGIEEISNTPIMENQIVLIDFETGEIIDLLQNRKGETLHQAIDRLSVKNDIFVELPDPEIEAIGDAGLYFLKENEKFGDQDIDFSKWDSSSGNIQTGRSFVVKTNQGNLFLVTISKFLERKVQIEDNGRKGNQSQNFMILEYKPLGEKKL